MAMVARQSAKRQPGRNVKLHQRAQDCFHLGYVSYGYSAIGELSSFVSLIRAAVPTTANADATTPPAINLSVGSENANSKET
jgi:hypothetical protein